MELKVDTTNDTGSGVGSVPRRCRPPGPAGAPYSGHVSIPLSLQPSLPDADDPLTFRLLVADRPGAVRPGPDDPVARSMIGAPRLTVDAWLTARAAAPPEPAVAPGPVGEMDRLLGMMPGRIAPPTERLGDGTVVDLDRDPAGLDAPWDAAGAVLLAATADQLGDAVALAEDHPALGARLIVVPETLGGDPAAALAGPLAAGVGCGVDLSWPVDPLADALALLAHGSGPLLLRAADTAAAIAGLSAVIAALTGFDIRQALTAPAPGRLTGLNVFAAAAVRELLYAIAVPDPAAVAADLAALGLGVPRRS